MLKYTVFPNREDVGVLREKESCDNLTAARGGRPREVFRLIENGPMLFARCFSVEESLGVCLIYCICIYCFYFLYYFTFCYTQFC